MRLGILGCGNMGEAFLKSILEANIVEPSEILVCEREKERIDFLVQKYGVRGMEEINKLSECDVLLLAIKPQNLSDLPVLEKDFVVITMLAGTPVQKVRMKFPQAKIARIMPNLGQFVGCGMTGLFWDEQDSFSSEEKSFVQKFIASDAEVVELKDEKSVDQLAAISGSGPAYFFLFAEKLVESAQKFGFSREEAELLVRQTLLGSAKIFTENPQDSFAEWRRKVTSPKGTTEQAVASFERDNLGEIIGRAVLAAEARARELEQ